MKIAFVHYRTSGLDGVSLEIDKRAEVLEEFGHTVYYITGKHLGPRPQNKGKIVTIPALSMKHPRAFRFLVEVFYNRRRNYGNFLSDLQFLYTSVYKKLDRFFGHIRPDLLFVHNLFSHAYNLPATVALLDIVQKYKIPALALHHDFWWEREYFKSVRAYVVKELLSRLPPDYCTIRHQVINSFAQEELYMRRGIKARRIGDYFDYSATLLKNPFRARKRVRDKFRIKENTLVILNACRIVPRKAIENTIRYASALGKISKQQVVVLLPNFVEVDAKDYFRQLKSLSKKLRVTTIFASKYFSGNRKTKPLFSFWDAYAAADIVAYTSIWEGFGNQFLEAVYFKKPLVVFEYPVFKRDIKPEGYRYIPLGDKYRVRGGFKFVPEKKLKGAAEITMKWLANPSKTDKIAERNFKIASRFHSFDKLRENLRDILNWALKVKAERRGAK